MKRLSNWLAEDTSRKVVYIHFMPEQGYYIQVMEGDRVFYSPGPTIQKAFSNLLKKHKDTK